MVCRGDELHLEFEQILAGTDETDRYSHSPLIRTVDGANGKTVFV